MAVRGRATDGPAEERPSLTARGHRVTHPTNRHVGCTGGVARAAVVTHATPSRELCTAQRLLWSLPTRRSTPLALARARSLPGLTISPQGAHPCRHDAAISQTQRPGGGTSGQLAPSGARLRPTAPRRPAASDAPATESRVGHAARAHSTLCSTPSSSSAPLATAGSAITCTATAPPLMAACAVAVAPAPPTAPAQQQGGGAPLAPAPLRRVWCPRGRRMLLWRLSVARRSRRGGVARCARPHLWPGA